MTKEFKTFLKTVGGNEGGKCHYPTRLDLYGCGCAHDCKYCYAKSLLDFRKLWHPLDPSVADPAKVRRAVQRIKPGSVVRLGGMTDCFQPAERTHRATLAAIHALNERGVGYLIVTKSDLVAEDEYLAAMRRDLAHIQVTVTCTDDAFCAQYEKAPPPSKRISAIERLRGEGFDIALRLSPFVPQFVGRGVLDMDRINAVRCDKILVEFLRVNSWIRKWFPVDCAEYTVKHGGYLHLPLERKREAIGMITGFREVSVCEDEDEAFAFWRDHFNPNPNDCCNLRRADEEYRTPGEALARLAFPMPSKCPPEMEGRAEMPLFTNPPFVAS